MLQIIYVSSAVKPFTDSEVGSLLARARFNNARLSVTGMLLYDRGSFLQVLEGEPATVRALFQKLSADPRHKRVVQLVEEVTEKRLFGSWTMGLVSIDRFRAANPPGLTSFVSPDFTVGDLANSGKSKQAREILLGFRGGRWRTYVEG